MLKILKIPLLSLFCFVVLLFSTAKADEFPSDPNTELWKDTKVDHFNGKDDQYFSQKYYINATSWDEEGGVIMFYLGNEAGLSGPPQFGYLLELAEKHKALLVSCEHRFYGDSIPNNNMSSSNLQYLTVEQAMADFSDFITFFNGAYLSDMTSERRWFVFGRSYGGALSSWFRIEYPYLSKGSLSSSGVVNSVLWYSEFDENTYEVISPICSQTIRQINSAFEQLGLIY